MQRRHLLSLLALSACRLERRPAAAGARPGEGRASTLAAAPDFELEDAYGKRRSLGSLTAGGAALLVFYRGYW